MHYLVSLIVEADDKEEANVQAETVMIDLINLQELDWYQTRTDDSNLSGCWEPILLSDQKARTMVHETMQSQYEYFKQDIATIRFMLENYTDEQIFNENFGQHNNRFYLSRYQFSRASGCHTNESQIYDSNGDAITNYRSLEAYINDPAKLWLVRVNCHN